MKALILAAGYALRLYPLTKQYPKPLLKVKSRPIIEYIIKKLELIDEIDEIIVITNSRFISLFEKWVRQLRIKKRISLVDDLTASPEHRLGAIGDINFAIDERKVNDDLLVIGGDNLLEDDLSDFLVFADKNKLHPVIGVYDIKQAQEAGKYGVIRLDKKNKIIDFAEKPAVPKSTLVAMCLYYFPKEKLGLIKEYLSLKKKSDATGFYIEWLCTRCAVYGFVFKGKWYDIGDHKFYNQAKENFSK